MNQIIETLKFDDARTLYEYLRLSRFDVWGQPGASDWIFRGSAGSYWLLLPSAWRDEGQDRLAPWKVDLRDRLTAAYENAEATRRQAATPEFCDIPSDYVIEAHAQLIAELEAVREFTRLRARNFAAPIWVRDDFKFDANPSWAWGESIPLQFSYNSHVALAQHHGVPTRLLDWSRNPSVALSFAVFDPRYFDDDAEILALDARTLQMPNDGAPTRSFLAVAEPPGDMNEFSFVQKSVHTYVPIADFFYRSHGKWPDHVELALEQGAMVKRISIKARLKRELGKMLWADGIDPVSLLPNLDGVGQATLIWPLIFR